MDETPKNSTTRILVTTLLEGMTNYVIVCLYLIMYIGWILMDGNLDAIKFHIGLLKNN